MSKLSHLKAMTRDWRWWPFHAQRLVRHPGPRRQVARAIATLMPRPAPMSAGGTAGADAQALETTGLTPIRAYLSAQECAETVAMLQNCAVSDDYRPEWPAFLPAGTGRHPDAHVAFHRSEDVIRAPHLLALSNRADVLDIAGRFLSCKPTIVYMAAWWSYPTSIGAQQAENFHRDVDDWRFVKFFTYLSDVDENQGPHVYVRGSANDDKLRSIRRFSDNEVRSIYAARDVLQLTAPAGHGFLENTNGIHKGQPVREGRRLMFQAVYGMIPLPYGPRRPVASIADVDRSGALDPFVNRVYLKP